MGTNIPFSHDGFYQNNSSPPFPGGTPNQQYFPSPGAPTNMMDFGERGNTGFMTPNGFQPELGLFNDAAFSTNNQFPPAQFQPRPFAPPPPTPPHIPQQLNSKAAELKARLLKDRGRASSATPSAGGMTGQNAQSSPRTPIPAGGEERDQNLNDLISQYSSKPVPESNTNIKREGNLDGAAAHKRSSVPDHSAKSQAPLLGSPTKVVKPTSNGKVVNNGPVSKSRHASNGSTSEASEGEIIEDPTPKKISSQPEPKQNQVPAKQINDGQATRKPREETLPKLPYTCEAREEQPSARATTNPNPKLLKRSTGDRREEAPAKNGPDLSLMGGFNEFRDLSLIGGPRAASRLERKSTLSEVHPERRTLLGSDKQPYPRREARDQNEEHRRTDVNPEPSRENNRPAREPSKPSIPTLAQVLPHDEDLREWLNITAYHNEPYRDKILKRRRAIAALDAQRNALLAEMEAEERGLATATMLPPPIPATTVVPSTEPASSEIQRDRVVSNKRPYSELQEEHEETGAGKILRTNDRGSRITKEEDDDFVSRRPRSSGYDPSYRSADRRPYADGHGRGRGISRDRDVSPGLRQYENRQPARRGGWESPNDDYFDHDEDSRDPRPFEVRGAYRGRAYDPNYRSRGGRGRGRGDFESRNEGPSTSFGSRIANGKPFKDYRGFNKGGKGDTRYFIVKSFNEDNVLKCIDDSIWTTQLQNGEIFKEAFQSCKNVILVFSINKSRAFQGYARMESLPGSIEVPLWQKAINWESAGAFRVRWLVVCATRFHRVGHLKNALNENQAVLIGKDGQEIEENCGAGLIELIDEEVDQALITWKYPNERGTPWDD